MKMFVFLAILFTLIIGLFFGYMFTTSMKGWKRVLVTFVIAVCVGCSMSVMFCIERNSDVKAWNNGYCECGCEWTFSNAEHLRNSGDFYYWYCKDCGKVIKLHTQFTK